MNPDGGVKAIEMRNKIIGRNAAEILRKLQASSFAKWAVWHMGRRILTGFWGWRGSAMRC